MYTEEFGPSLHYIKGDTNTVIGALSCLAIRESLVTIREGYIKDQEGMHTQYTSTEEHCCMSNTYILTTYQVQA
eukprot:8637579-Ditylum_brightwellii.AAC.1